MKTNSMMSIDDALDAFGCHGIGGIWGGIATGIFGKSSINPVAKWDGLVYGEWRLFVAQIEGILITIVIAVVGTLICVAIVRILLCLLIPSSIFRISVSNLLSAPSPMKLSISSIITIIGLVGIIALI